RQELPYSVRVEIESWVENRIPNIFAVIHVDSDSRKGILIGKGGLGLKRIGMAARKDIEKMIGRQVCLKLHVHVERDWRKDRGKVSQYLELE
ncbi:MAG: KH domain-containing protein, partial [Deltaproteobacteria bacterium]|nr:KH domain-containing protein [Deltaproteobacteria bacterium]